MTGYLHPSYAHSLSEFGAPRELPASGGWVLRRPIASSGSYDAMGCYPLFVCRDWHGLEDDIDALAAEVVALSLVTDPLGDYDGADLHALFPDLCRPFKNHFVVDLDSPAGAQIPAHHARNLRRGQREVDVERTLDPAAHAGEWISLYEHLIIRHGIRGVSAFSPASLVSQLAVAGLTMLRAVHRGSTVGITLWYTQGEAAYYHLGAYSDAGYSARASFALLQYAIEHFRGRVRWLNLGAGAGAAGGADDGLTRFKRGWATGTRTAWLCGRVFDRDRYAQLARSTAPGEAYFPAYRAGEFA